MHDRLIWLRSVIAQATPWHPPSLSNNSNLIPDAGSSSGGLDANSDGGGGSGACAEAVAGRLLPAVALHLLASGSRADAGGAKGGELRQVLGACRAARYRFVRFGIPQLLSRVPSPPGHITFYILEIAGLVTTVMSIVNPQHIWSRLQAMGMC